MDAIRTPVAAILLALVVVTVAGAQAVQYSFVGTVLWISGERMALPSTADRASRSI